MARGHVNPETGEPGICGAEYSCPFGGSFNGHESSKRRASALYEGYRENLHEPNGASYFYFLSDEDHERYTSGECGDLAAELHRLTGYPLVAMGSRWNDGRVLWDHIAVRAPDGRILDVTGIQPESGTVKAWGYDPESFEIETIELNEIDGRLGDPGLEGEPGSKDAAILAKLILRRLRD